MSGIKLHRRSRSLTIGPACRDPGVGRESIMGTSYVVVYIYLCFSTCGESAFGKEYLLHLEKLGANVFVCIVTTHELRLNRDSILKAIRSFVCTVRPASLFQLWDLASDRQEFQSSDRSCSQDTLVGGETSASISKRYLSLIRYR